jgi:hypothetical protein
VYRLVPIAALSLRTMTRNAVVYLTFYYLQERSFSAMGSDEESNGWRAVLTTAVLELGRARIGILHAQ